MSSQAKAAVLFISLVGCAHAEPARELPSSFEAGRVYMTPTTLDGHVLRLYTDSGGGLFLTQSIVEQLGLETGAMEEVGQAEDGQQMRHVRLPAFADGKGIPAPISDDGRLLVMPTQANEQLPGMSAWDGILGQAWFSGRIWTWDYPGKHLRIEDTDWQAPAGLQRVALGFKSDAAGKRETDFPRIEIKVDGRTLPVLLDTGAMTVLTPEALARLGDSLPAERATSMVVDSIFQSWRKAHPDWRVIEKAQAGTGSAMIEVPEVEIAGYRVGPVWFTHRPDRNFHEGMSQWMDMRVEGAIGGNVLQGFVMTVDYPAAAAYFRCVADCTKSQ